MNLSILGQLLPWVLPPVVGAIIGYVTNHIAIKMLFRPLTEKRLFGIKLPLTPGIIPKQRLTLAESIGKMVSQQLITEETFRSQVASSGFQQQVKQSIAGYTGILSRTPLSALTREKQKEMYEAVEGALSHFLKQFLGSPYFPALVKQFLSHASDYFLHRRLHELVRQEDLTGWLKTKVFPLLTGAETREWLKKRLQGWLNEKQLGDKPLKILIPSPVVNFITHSLASFLPHLIDSLFVWLRSPEVKAELRQRGGLLLIDVLNKLNVFQKFFVSLAQYDKTLGEKMPQIIDDALNHLELSLNQVENKEAIIKAVDKAIRQWRERKIGEVARQAGMDLSATAERLFTFVFRLLENENFKSNFEKLIHDSLTTAWDAYKESSIETLIKKFLGLEKQELIDKLFAALQKYFTGKINTDQYNVIKFTNYITNSFSTFLEQRESLETIGSLLNIEEKQKAELDELLFRYLISLIDKNIPRIIESLDVKQLVINKINQLDILQVENLLLMVIAKQLKWIDIFGAILGGLMGLGQVFINLL
jgi:uncharacterized membrane protein YheB (UPF0754 family)